jgi:hypothetical protein
MLKQDSENFHEKLDRTIKKFEIFTCSRAKFNYFSIVQQFFVTNTDSDKDGACCSVVLLVEFFNNGRLEFAQL